MVQPRYEALDCLRGIAALSVMIYHICVLFGHEELLRYAHLAVDFFFILSGFIISRAYGAKLEAKLPLSDFLLIRVKRLYPMIVLGGILGAGALVARVYLKHDMTFGDVGISIVLNLFLVPTLGLSGHNRLGFPLNPPLWSLSVEMLINLVYAATIRFLSTSVLVLTCLVGAAISIWSAVVHGGLNFGYADIDYFWGYARVLYTFPAGVLLSRLVGSRTIAHAPLYIVMVALAFLLMAPLGQDWRIECILVLFLFPLLIALSIYAPLPSFLTNFWLLVGELSYPIYALNYPIVQVFEQIEKRLRLPDNLMPFMMISCFLVNIITAYGASKFVDGPCRRYFARRAKRIRSVSTGA